MAEDNTHNGESMGDIEMGNEDITQSIGDQAESLPSQVFNLNLNILVSDVFGESAAERIKKRQRSNRSQRVTEESIRSTAKRMKPTIDLVEQTSILAAQERLVRQTTGVDIEDQLGADSQLHQDVAQADRLFAALILADMEYRIPRVPNNVGLRQMKRIAALLKIAAVATQAEGPWVKEEGASEYLAAGAYHDGPIFFSNQQPMPLMSIEGLLSEFYDDNAGVWIQDPAMKDVVKSTREVDIGAVKVRLRSGTRHQHPWNCLEMAAPFEDGTRPKFLNTEECRLLTKIKIPNPEPYFNGAKVGRRFLRHGYKEAEKWVLLAEAGALTEPHQDSHGYSTYITVNEGLLGFGWAHQPTAQQRRRWLKNPHKFADATWRYRILRPGDTVYFPAGTVHFVFRHPELGHTLAFGGHVLRCSTIVQWLQAMKDESFNQAVTNEELTTAAYGYVQQVACFVEQAREACDMARWGGAQSVDAFLKMKDELLSKQTSRRKSVAKS